MNQPYSQWHARNAADNLPLAARYQTADPIRWNGSMVYPMYTEQIGPAPIWVSMTLLSAAPPVGLRGHGIGLSVIDGYIGLADQRLGGVDVWSDALTAGITFELFPNDPGAMFSLTPVWVDPFGIQQSWSGNYGMLIEQPPSGQLVLWCSVGEGPPNFANLVVELAVQAAPVEDLPAPSQPAAVANEAAVVREPPGVHEPAVTHEPAVAHESAVAPPPKPTRSADPDYRSALYDLGVAMYNRGEEDQACGLWAQAAESGHPAAAYDLGVVRFRRGDLADAERWWRAAADGREPRAMIGLAELLERRGNSSEARVWRACAAQDRVADTNHSLSSS
jgi:hypothetical protein